MKQVTLIIAIIFSLNGIANSIEKDSTVEIQSLNYEYFKNNLKSYKTAKSIDSLWLSELYKSSLIDTSSYIVDIDSIEVFNDAELPTELLKERLAHLNSKTPFNIDYSPELEKLIKFYLQKRRKSLANIIGRSQYYFPVFEEHLAKNNIPLELKYLAIIESALNPRAKSRVGATGLWQFMYQTGIQYGLKVSSYVDERSNPIKSTEAASKYLLTLYNVFGDWNLALAAYNSGPGNVTKAIRRSGGKTNYWNLRPYLPRETANYVPAFYATLYLMEFAKEHNLQTNKVQANFFETDTIHIKKQISFEQINKMLDVDVELLQFLNPQFKLDIVPFVKGENNFITLPINTAARFVSNEELVYAIAQEEESKREKQLPQNIITNDRIRYKVRSGDNLGKIANKYGVNISQIKKWNNLKSSTIRAGQYLTIYPRST
ncbi:MAG TPA: transglycosylase SLT domain-containing protein [Flavobacteriaceae bacterium]|nr:transglycosylase SLT domain-containing protein [Flavobacteriaceae bacterium]HEX5742672.1 transglycosylase SLT domain-containing protein [Flavobacteriaceae bacterium]